MFPRKAPATRPSARPAGFPLRGSSSPATTSASPRRRGSTIRSNQPGSSTLTAVTAITSASATWIAAFLPRARFPATISQCRGRRVDAAKSCSISGVPSVEPPSVITMTSGIRLWASNEARNSRICRASLRTVTTIANRTRRHFSGSLKRFVPIDSRQVGPLPWRGRPEGGVSPPDGPVPPEAGPQGATRGRGTEARRLGRRLRFVDQRHTATERAIGCVSDPPGERAGAAARNVVRAARTCLQPRDETDAPSLCRRKARSDGRPRLRGPARRRDGEALDPQAADLRQPRGLARPHRGELRPRGADCEGRGETPVPPCGPRDYRERAHRRQVPPDEERYDRRLQRPAGIGDSPRGSRSEPSVLRIRRRRFRRRLRRGPRERPRTRNLTGRFAYASAIHQGADCRGAGRGSPAPPDFGPGRGPSRSRSRGRIPSIPRAAPILRLDGRRRHPPRPQAEPRARPPEQAVRLHGPRGRGHRTRLPRDRATGARRSVRMDRARRPVGGRLRDPPRGACLGGSEGAREDRAGGVRPEVRMGPPGRTVPQNRPRRDGGSRGVKRLRIAFVASSDSTFIQRDRELLRRFAAVRDVRWTGIRSIPRLAWAVMRSDAAFAWFALDHAYGACRLARLFRRKSFVFVGGVDVANVPELGYGAHIDPRTAARSGH